MRANSTTTIIPTGTVTFEDGATILGTGTLDGSGKTTYTTSALSVGSHSITAVYSGDSNFAGSASSAITDMVCNFTVLRTLPATVGKGQTFNVTVIFTAPADNFNAIGLSDFAPAGWTVSANNTWNTPNSDTNNITANRVDYIWNGPFTKGTAFTAVYQVTVSANATPGIYNFSGGTLQYYVGSSGPTTINVSGNSQVQVVNGAIIQGKTYEGKGLILSGVTLTLDGTTQVISAADGSYQLIAATTGSHTVVASKTGYRSQTQTVNVTDLTATYPLDFKAGYGLVPNAPDISYVLACINKWKYPPADGTGLDISKILSVINAWKFPITSLTPKSGGILRVIFHQLTANFGYPPTMDANAQQVVFPGCLEPIMDIDLNGQFINDGLVTAYQMSADGMSYTMTLRQGVKFHDGTDWNASAAQWNLNQNIAA